MSQQKERQQKQQNQQKQQQKQQQNQQNQQNQGQQQHQNQQNQQKQGQKQGQQQQQQQHQQQHENQQQQQAHQSTSSPQNPHPNPNPNPNPNPTQALNNAPNVHPANKQNRQVKKDEGRGKVKAVISGDTVILLLIDKAQGGPPPEKEITLASVSAPRLARKDKEEEVFAWESREFLRKKLIGQAVSYIVTHVAESKNGTREYGNIFLNDENIIHSVIANGWAHYLPPPQAKDLRPEQQECVQLSSEAEHKKLGIFNPDKSKGIRRVVSKFDSLELFERLKGKLVPALVEQVRSGSVLRVSLLEETPNTGKLYYNLIIRLAGASSPNIPFSNEQAVPPFAKDAKLFTESRLLHRWVDIYLKAPDHNKGDTFAAKVLIGDKNLAEELLKQGLAQYVDWNAPRDEVERLKAAEKSAKNQKLRIWQNYHPEEDTSDGPVSVAIWKVREVRDGGVLLVVDTTSPQKKLVNLSSISVPRLGGPNREGGPDRPDQPYAWEAKEFLRSKLIGKKVRLVLDYARVPRNSTEKKEFYTVFLEKSNIALFLVEKGLAKVISHSPEELRSPYYDALVLTEKKAQKKGKGVHGNPEQAPIHRFNDLTVPPQQSEKANKSKDPNNKQTDPKKRDTGKAKSFLPFLKKGRLSGVVEFVYSGARFKICIPKESCIINFTLTGVRAPQKRPDHTEPYAEEASEFSREKLHQHDVELEVESHDKGGTFIGTLFLNKKNFAVTLLEEGLASLHTPSATRSPFFNELNEAEALAKQQKKQIWTNYDEAAEAAKRKQELEEQENQKNKNDHLRITVTEVVDASSFYVQIDSEELHQLDDLMKQLQTVASSNELPHNYEPKVRDLVACKFSEDDVWYRAQIKTVSSDSPRRYGVFYVDYGNEETTSIKSIRPLDPGFCAFPRQAQLCFLAFIQAPKLEDDFGQEAADFLKDLVWNKKMIANLEYRDSEGRMYLSCGDEHSRLHVNAELVKRGLARVNKRDVKYHRAGHLVGKLLEEEQQARKLHLYIWQYGDIPDEDEDDDFGERRRRGRK